jgi:hypothetical protein
MDAGGDGNPSHGHAFAVREDCWRRSELGTDAQMSKRPVGRSRSNVAPLSPCLRCCTSSRSGGGSHPHRFHKIPRAREPGPPGDALQGTRPAASKMVWGGPGEPSASGTPRMGVWSFHHGRPHAAAALQLQAWPGPRGPKPELSNGRETRARRDATPPRRPGPRPRPGTVANCIPRYPRITLGIE